MPAPKGNKNAKGNRGGRGGAAQKFVYSQKLIPLVKLMVLHGATDKEIADAIGISRETLRWWRFEHVEFANGIRVTNEEMAEVARASLFRRAIGYTFECEKVFQFQGSIIRAATKEHVPPDVNAALRILQAYDREQVWREKTDAKVNNTFSLADLVALSMEQRARKAAEQAKLIEAQANRPENDE
jgi:transcriptional regulator with XRE-family HTH domain